MSNLPVNGARYPLGIPMNRPYNNVSQETLETIVDLINKLPISANDCVSKGQLKDMLKQSIAKQMILERRQVILNDRLVAFRNQCQKLEMDDPIRLTYEAFLVALVEGMERG